MVAILREQAVDLQQLQASVNLRRQQEQTGSGGGFINTESCAQMSLLEFMAHAAAVKVTKLPHVPLQSKIEFLQA